MHVEGDYDARRRDRTRPAAGAYQLAGALARLAESALDPGGKGIEFGEDAASGRLERGQRDQAGQRQIAF